MKIPAVELAVGEKLSYAFGFAVSAEQKGTTVSSVAWTVPSGNSATISGTPALSSGVSTGLIVADSQITGTSLIKATATMANGEIGAEYLNVKVVDPS